MVIYGAQVLEALDVEGNQWSANLGKAWEGDLMEREYSLEPRPFDGVPRRDERFPDPYNMGVNAEVFLYDEDMPAQAKTLMMFYKRLREIDVPEMMASIIAETEGKPWGYYRDMTRQLWDESRHAMMGEVGFAQAGVDWPRQVMVNFTWSLALNTQLDPKERHAVLYFIEQGLMPKTGKRYEWEVAKESGNRLSALFQDFDWADEVLHARVGRDWYLSEFDDPKEAVKYGDQCWSRVLMDWGKYKEDGESEHRNWWPDCYRAACEANGEIPDDDIMTFDTSYEQVRADLKNLSASVVGFTLATSNGDLVTASATNNSELYTAARQHLGAFGIITRINLQLRTAYRLAENSWRAGLDELLEDSAQHIAENRHFEFFWYPAVLNRSQSRPKGLEARGIIN